MTKVFETDYININFYYNSEGKELNPNQTFPTALVCIWTRRHYWTFSLFFLGLKVSSQINIKTTNFKF